MSAPDTSDLETTLMQLESGIGVLHIFAEEVQSAGNASGGADLHWLATVLKRDLNDAIAWHAAAHEANVAARGNGPVAVT